MQKINFQNLPNTTTPVNASNLNDLQDNIEDVFNGNEAMGDILVGDITVQDKVQLGTGGISDYNEAGFEHDQYGNWQHKRDTVGDTWSIKNYSGTSTFTIYPETGSVNINGTLNGIDISSDNTWQSSGMNNSFTYYKKRNGWCIVKFTSFGDATVDSNELTLGTLPQGYRPNARIGFIFNGISGDTSTCYGYINEYGVIKLGKGSGSTTYFDGSVVFPIDS